MKKVANCTFLLSTGMLLVMVMVYSIFFLELKKQ